MMKLKNAPRMPKVALFGGDCRCDPMESPYVISGGRFKRSADELGLNPAVAAAIRAAVSRKQQH